MAVDNWPCLDETDVITPWQFDFGKLLVSAKWQERKESLEALITLVKKNPKLDRSVSYDEIVLALKKILTSDSNINVVQNALEAISHIALGLRSAFSPYANRIIGNVLDKSKEKKQSVRDAVAVALDSLASTTSAERIEGAIMEHIAKPSPLSKLAILEFLYRYFVSLTDVPLSFLKSTLPTIIKLTGDADVKVREASCICLGSAKRLLGDSITVFLQTLTSDKGKMDKIESACEKAKEEHALLKKDDVYNGVVVDGPEELNNVEQISGSEKSSSNIDPWTLQDPIDLVSSLPPTFNDLIASKKWQERKEAMDSLEGLLQNKPRLTCNTMLLDMVEALLKVLEKDVNVNVASGSAQCLSGIIYGIRDEFPVKYCCKAATVSFDKMKDKKEVLRKELNGLLHTISMTFHIDVYSDSVISGMNSKNPQCRSQTCGFLNRLLAKMDSQTLPFPAIKNLKDSITKCSTDADAEVRDAALLCVTAVWKAAGEQVVSTIFADIMEDKIRAEKIKCNMDKLKDEFGTSASAEMRRIYKREPAKEKPVSKPAVPVKAASKPTTRPVVQRPATAVVRTPRVGQQALSGRAPLSPARPNVVASAPPPVVRALPIKPKVAVPRPMSATTVPAQPKTLKPAGSFTPRVVRTEVTGTRAPVPRAPVPRAPLVVPNVVRAAPKSNPQVSQSVMAPIPLRPVTSKPRPDSARFGFRPSSKPSSRAGSRASSPVR